MDTPAENAEKKLDNVLDFPNANIEAGPAIPEPVREGLDPVVDPADLALVAKTKASLEVLKIESKTIVGFVSDHLVSRYNVRSQEQFDRMFGVFG